MLITTSEKGLKVYNSQSPVCEATTLDPTIWPNIIGYENVSSPVSRNGMGPLSIKYVIKGKEKFHFNGCTKTVDKNSFLIVNHEQPYVSSIEDNTTESMSVFFNPTFVTNTVNGMLSSNEQLLNHDVFKYDVPITFFQHLYEHDKTFSKILEEIGSLLKNQFDDVNYYNQTLHNLITNIILRHNTLNNKIHKLPPTKKSTKLEIFKRINVAKDFIESNYSNNINLEEAAKEACLSKFYFLRAFKMVLGKTPYAYLTEKRMRTAKEMIEKTDLSIGEISYLSGYHDISTFSKAYKKYYKEYPSQNRLLIAN